MKNNSYISDFELEKIQVEYSRQIESYLKLRNFWQDYYEIFGLKYPSTSDNNFRDSWFHYRKIYKERSINQMLSQTANYEEHLQRAERDAIVKFFQDISTYLDNWYFIGLESDKGESKLDYALLDSWAEKDAHIKNGKITTTNWIYSLWRSCSSKDVFIKSCELVFIKYIWSKTMQTDLQKLLHLMKNKVLQIRLNSSEIHRVKEIGDLTKTCEPILDSLAIFCNTYYMTLLIAFTKEYNNLGYANR